MKIIGTQYRELLADSGYRLFTRKSDTECILVSEDRPIYELWVLNDSHSGYTIEIDGQGYEFVETLHVGAAGK